MRSELLSRQNGERVAVSCFCGGRIHCVACAEPFSSVFRANVPGQWQRARPTFSVRVTHDKKPLSGATVTLHGWTPVGTEVESVIVTDSNGIARVAGVQPGNYGMTAKFLGIGAWSDCFHVNSNSSILATRRLTIEWGQFPNLSSGQLDGTLVESRPPATGTPLWRASHRAEVALDGVHLNATNVETRAVASATSGVDGTFTFGSLPDGDWVLHIDDSDSISGYNLLFRVNARGHGKPLIIERRDSGCGTGFDVQLR